MEWKNKMDRSTGTNGLMSYAKLRNKMSLRFAKHYCQHCYHAGDDPCPVHGRREMTPEQINREIAEKVMGWSGPISLGDDPRLFFDPANCIDHAWMVVEKLRQSQYFLILSENPFAKAWKAKFTNIRTPECDVQEFGDTAQMAICLAALEAVKEGWEDRHGRTSL
jgi:hypothetical protein